jgi:hypothetical protein
MTPEQRAQLQQVVDEGNLGRIFKDLGDLGRRIETFAAHYAEKSKAVARGALPATSVSLDSVLAAFRSNPYRVQVLLQAMAFGCTPEMLAMIWMSELGCAIQKLTLDYERRDRFFCKSSCGSLMASRSSLPPPRYGTWRCCAS